MIIELVMTTLLGAMTSFFAGVLPDSSISPESAAGFVHWYAWLNSFLPLSEAVGLIATSVGVVAVIGAFAGAMTIWRLVPGKAT